MRKRFLLRCCFALVVLAAPAFASAADFSVLVSIADQQVSVYRGERLVRSMVCSTGLLDGDNDTPLGDYIIDESGTKLHIVAERPSLAKRGVEKAEVSGWIALRGASYRQKYRLSCEIALTRLCLGLMGLEASEDEILAAIPRSGQDPESGSLLVTKDSGAGRDCFDYRVLAIFSN